VVSVADDFDFDLAVARKGRCDACWGARSAVGRCREETAAVEGPPYRPLT
jgi:hypothetical protein